FTAVPGEIITSISIAWGSSALSDPNLDGLPYTVVVWSDPNGDGSPDDAEVLTIVYGVVAQQGTDTFIETPITPTVITTPSFFVGFMITHSAGQFPSAFDQSTGIPNRSFLAGAPVGGPAGDIFDLNNNPMPVAPIESFGSFFGNWLIRIDTV